MEKLAIEISSKHKPTSDRAGAGGQLSFALYGAAYRMARMRKPFLDPLGLTFPQYLVLLELFSNAPSTVGDLGGKLGMDAGTITPLLKRLASSGRITRTRDTADERRVLVDLTPAGEVLRTAVLAVGGQIKSACRLSSADIQALRDALNGLARPAD